MIHPSGSGSRSKPAKPRPDFPLFPHATGRWAKKVKGKLVYFGKIADDPNGEAALTLWLDQIEELLAGRKPRAKGDAGVTLAELCFKFLQAKKLKLDTGLLSPHSYRDYCQTAARLVQAFGEGRAVADL